MPVACSQTMRAVLKHATGDSSFQKLQLARASFDWQALPSDPAQGSHITSEAATDPFELLPHPIQGSMQDSNASYKRSHCARRLCLCECLGPAKLPGIYERAKPIHMLSCKTVVSDGGAGLRLSASSLLNSRPSQLPTRIGEPKTIRQHVD